MTTPEVQDEKIRQHENRINGMESHIEIANREMGELRDGINKVDTKVESIKTDVDWLKRFFWVVATSSIGALITGVIGVIEKLN